MCHNLAETSCKACWDLWLRSHLKEEKAPEITLSGTGLAGRLTLGGGRALGSGANAEVSG